MVCIQWFLGWVVTVNTFQYIVGVSIILCIVYIIVGTHVRMAANSETCIIGLRWNCYWKCAQILAQNRWDFSSTFNNLNWTKNRICAVDQYWWRSARCKYGYRSGNKLRLRPLRDLAATEISPCDVNAGDIMPRPVRQLAIGPSDTRVLAFV